MLQVEHVRFLNFSITIKKRYSMELFYLLFPSRNKYQANILCKYYFIFLLGRTTVFIILRYVLGEVILLFIFSDYFTRNRIRM